MRRLLKLIATGALAAAAVQLLRRLLGVGAEPSASETAPASAGRQSRAVETAPAGAEPIGDPPTRQQLYREAQEIGVEGRSKMNKRQLREAVEAAKTGSTT